MKPNYVYRLYDVEVVDGDTIRPVISLGFGKFHGYEGHKKTKESIRLYGINTPETTRRGSWDKGLTEEQIHRSISKGLAAKEAVKLMVEEATHIYLQSTQFNVSGKFGRLLGIVWLYFEGDPNPINLNKWLVDKGHAVYKDY